LISISIKFQVFSLYADIAETPAVTVFDSFSNVLFM